MNVKAYLKNVLRHYFREIIFKHSFIFLEMFLLFFFVVFCIFGIVYVTSIFALYFFLNASLGCTAAFTYYYDPAILRNKMKPLSIFRDLAQRKRDSKKCLLLCVL